MSHVRLRLIAALTLVGAFRAPAVYAAPPAGFILAADDGITVHDAWARASAGAATNGAAYISLTGGAQPDSLIAVSTPIAATAQAHETTSANGVMQMRAEPVIAIPAGQTVTFAPGGNHIMLMGLKHPLTAGERFPLTLTFAHAPPVTVDVQVRGRSTAAAGDDHMHMKMQ